METTAPSPPFLSFGGDNRLSISSWQLRTAWLAFVAVTILSELWPMPLLPRGWFYSIWSAKLLSFGIVGLLAPLAFRRFNAFVGALLFGVTTASAVEILQGLVNHGHSFHLYELLVKSLLVTGAFCLGVLARYRRNVSLGPISIRLNTAS